MIKTLVSLCLSTVCLLFAHPSISQENWTDCAAEGGQCTFSGTKRVRFGEGNRWVEDRYTNSVACSNGVFGDPSPGNRKRCQYAEFVNWSTCANENGACNFSGTRAVRFGKGSTWKSSIHLGGVSCRTNVFGDPLPRATKECQTANVRWRGCSVENASCNFSGTRIIRYGANGQWVERSVTNGTACTNQAFGRDPAPGVRKTCYFAQLMPEPKLMANAWSDPDTWGGAVPSRGNITVPAGKNVLLDMNLLVDTLTIDGNVECAHTDLRISARVIMVHGQMTCGKPGRPHTKSLIVTLTGRKPANVGTDGRGMGTKVFAAMNGGVLNLHGEDRTSWLMLNQTANAGSNQIVLEGTTDWRRGDRLVVTSTGESMKEAEEVTIASVNGRVITLTSPLRYRHFGEIQYFSNSQRTWEADTRAEVGLLSRNILVRGDASSESEKFGGHMMVMRGSEGYLSGVQLERLGQQGILARYPFHWHLAGDVRGQYIRNSSITNSFNRCVTVHGSFNARVDDNVCFKHVGHGYFLEDGIETGNVFNHNLGVWTIKPSEADALIESDRSAGPAAKGPATFWISNGDNTYTNNSAAGSEGLGFWYDTDPAVTGPSRNLPGGNINPSVSKFGLFKDNRVHSSVQAFSVCQRRSGARGYNPPGGQGGLFENLTVFHGGGGAVWPCENSHRFENLMVLDTGTLHTNSAFVAARPATINNSLFVANSKLGEGNKKRRSAFGIYDFGVEITNTHIENYSEGDSSPVFSEVGGALTFMHQSLRNISTRNSDFWLRLRNQNDPANRPNVSTIGSVIRDLDNTMGRGNNMSLTPNIPLMTDSSCRDLSGQDQGTLCPGRFVQIRLGMGITNMPALKLGRSDLSITRNMTAPATANFYKIYMPANRNYRFEVDFANKFTNGEFAGRNSFSVALDSGVDGDRALLTLSNLKSSARVTSNGWTQVNSLNALNSQRNNSWYKQGNTIILRMVARGNDLYFKARSRATIGL